MKEDYPEGAQFKIRLIETGEEYIITANEYQRRRERSQQGGFYTIRRPADPPGVERHVLSYQIAPSDHPIWSQIEKWKTECRERGFERLMIGLDGGKIKCFYAMSGGLSYQNIKKTNDHVRFIADIHL
jgi:hypothetical protein